MDVFKFGLSHWKKYLPAAILVQLISFAALTADLMIPMISEMFIDYVICKNVPDGRGIFSFAPLPAKKFSSTPPRVQP